MQNEISVDRVYLARGSTDMRKSIDGLAVLVQEVLDLDPFSPNLFAFCNRKRDKLKILYWDKNGFWLYYRRLERGKFQWPSDQHGSKPLKITRQQLRWLLDGYRWNKIKPIQRSKLERLFEKNFHYIRDN